jgi:hypothetical protein
MGLWPLLAAIKCHNLTMTRLLLDHGASPKTTTTTTELHALADTQKGPFPPVRVRQLIIITTAISIC